MKHAIIAFLLLLVGCSTVPSTEQPNIDPHSIIEPTDARLVNAWLRDDVPFVRVLKDNACPQESKISGSESMA